MRRRRDNAAALVAAFLCTAAASCTAAFAQTTPNLVSQTEFRVCADPHDLPFSNDQKQGYENAIADLVGQSLSLPVTYTWYPDSMGFVRETLKLHRCDVVIGTVAGVEDMDTTNPYLHTGYMLVTRTADHLDTNDVGDPRLLGRRFGVVQRTPPVDLVIAHNLGDSTQYYDLVVDTRVEQPAQQMLRDLADSRIDVALVWGPVAGYAITHDHLPLHAVFIDPKSSKIRLDYRIAMGVRPGDIAFRRALNSIVLKDQSRITAILDRFGIPQMDDQGHQRPPAAPP